MRIQKLGFIAIVLIALVWGLSGRNQSLQNLDFSQECLSVEECLPLAEKGDAEAQYWLARYYKYKTENKEDDHTSDQLHFYAFSEATSSPWWESSLRWYKEAAASGHEQATLDLGYIYFDGSLGVKSDKNKAKTFFLKWVPLAAKSSKADASYMSNVTGIAQEMRSLLAIASEENMPDLVKALLESGEPHVHVYAIRGEGTSCMSMLNANHLKRWLHSIYGPCDCFAYCLAVKNSHDDVVKIYLEKGAKVSGEVVTVALKNDDKEMMQLFSKYNSDNLFTYDDALDDLKSNCSCIAEDGKAACCDWFGLEDKSSGIPAGINEIQKYALEGDIKSLQETLEKHGPYEPQALQKVLSIAAVAGHADIVKLFIDDEAVISAMENKQLILRSIKDKEIRQLLKSKINKLER